MVVVVQDELQITLDPRPWTLGHALSFSITHPQKEMAYPCMLCSYFWKNKILLHVTRFPDVDLPYRRKIIAYEMKPNSSRRFIREPKPSNVVC
jgi:hypothetical protein